MDGAISLVVAALATWRLAAYLYLDNGPWDVFARLRTRAGVYDPPEQRRFWAGQLSCFWCCSLWAALVCAAVWAVWWYALVPFALSGAAILLSHGGRIIWKEMSDS